MLVIQHRYFVFPLVLLFIICILQVNIYIRVVFLKLGEIDTVNEKFSADAFVQARWREPSMDGECKVSILTH